MSYEPSNVPNDPRDVPRFLSDELRRISGGLGFLRYIRVSRDYDLSASATVTVPDEELPDRGIALLAMTGGGSPRSTAFQFQRTGTSNGCYILFNTYVGQEWGFGSTSEPSHGTEGRLWVDGTSAGASVKIKNMTATNTTLRLLSVEI